MKKILISVSILLAATIILIYSEGNKLFENPFESSRLFDKPSQTVSVSDNVLLVTDRSKTRVTVLTDYKVSATINGRKESNGFFYGEHTAFKDGKIYIADVKYEEGSTRVDAERIMQFSGNGRFEKVLFERTYENDKPFQYGNILDMRVHDGILNFLMQNKNTIELYHLSDDGVPVKIRTISAENAPYTASAVYNVFTDRVYTVSKNGLIYSEVNPEELTILMDFSRTDVILWGIALDSSGAMYISDLAAQSIIYADGSVFRKGQKMSYTD